MSQQTSKMGVTDSVTAELGKATHKDWSRDTTEKLRIRANVEVMLFGPAGRVKYHEIGENLVTDYGDEHIANRLFDDDGLIVTGMRLGDDSTPPTETKAGVGAAIEGYITGSNEDLDATATESDLGAGSGHRVIHVCTWIAGDITNGAISNVVLTDETPLTDVAGSAANTAAKFVFGATIDKQAGDSLVVTWNVDFLGA